MVAVARPENLVRQIRKLYLLQDLQRRLLLLVDKVLLVIDVSTKGWFIFEFPLVGHFLVSFHEDVFAEVAGDGDVLALGRNVGADLVVFELGFLPDGRE